MKPQASAPPRPEPLLSLPSFARATTPAQNERLALKRRSALERRLRDAAREQLQAWLNDHRDAGFAS